MTSLSIQAITHVILFILRFKDENGEQRDEFLLTEDLRTVQLQNLHDIFQRNGDHPFSCFRVRNYDLEDDDLVLREIRNTHQSRASNQHNCNCLICVGIRTNKMFREIYIPLSKALFIKVINFLPGRETILSTREIYDIIYNLFMILDNTNIITCILLKQLLADEGLFDKLSILHKDTVHRVMNNYQGTLEAKILAIRSQEHIIQTAFFNIRRIAMDEFVFVYKDEYNNVALTTSKGDNKRRIHYTADINVEDLLKPFYYLKIDSAFLNQNYLQLQELLYRNSLVRPNVTLDIDFSKFYQLYMFLLKHIIPDAMTQSEVFEKLLPGIFKYVDSFRLRLSEVTCSIDFRFLLDKKTTLFCNDIVFTSTVYLPQNLKCILIHDSSIEGDFILPASTKALSLKRVFIDKEAKVTINYGCLRVVIEETVGDIGIPDTFGIDALSFNKRWTKCCIVRNSTGAIEEVSIVEAELYRDWAISVSVKNIYLERIKTQGIFRIIINANSESLLFKNCKAGFNLAENALLRNFGLIEFSRHHEFHLSCENGQYKLSMVNIHLNTVRTLNEKIKALEIKNGHVQDGTLLSIHIGCQNIFLKNCRGSFEFFFGTNQRRINLSERRNFFSLQFNEHSGKYKLSLIKINIDVNWILWNKLEDLHLESFTNESSQYFEIKEGCNKIGLVNCKGLLKIPGIQSADQGGLRLSISINELCLRKLPDNLFQLHMSDIFFHQTIHILPAIKSAKLEGIIGYNGASMEFKAQCEILCLTNCNVGFKQSEENVNERLILNKMFKIDCILKAQTKELFVNNCTITKRVQLCSTLYKLHFYDVKVLKKNTVIIPEQCMNVMVKKSFGTFIIQGLNEDKNRATMFFERNGNLHFFRYKDNGHYLLKIENCNIKGRICIRRDIKEINLSNVTFTLTRLPEKVDKRIVMDSKSLQSLTLKSCPFLYNATIHRKLTYLHLEGMYFNHDVVIGDSVKSLILKDVVIERNSSIVLGESILYLGIYNINGVLNFNGFLDFKRLRFFGDEKVVYEKELQSRTVRLEVEGLTFVSDYRVVEEVKILHLTRIKTKNNSKVLVNRGCKKIVSDFEGRIYFIEEKNIDKAVFINLIPLFEMGCWTFATSHNIKEIRTPSNLKSIIFKDIELIAATVTINKDCENVSIIHCGGNFNLSKTPRILRLTFHPGRLKEASLTYSDLAHIDELDLAFDFMFNFFEHLLCNCFNVRILTLRTLTFIPNYFNWWRFITTNAKPFLSFFEDFRLMELKKSLSENFLSEERTSSLWILLNEKMNILITPIFNTRSQFKIEALRIVGFYLTDKNLEKLSNYSIMTKLSIDYNFVNNGLFECLPPNLETLEILSSDIFEPDSKNSMKNERNAEALKKMSCPKMLIIEGSFFEAPNNFYNLPQNLHSLKITYYDMTYIVYEPSIEKICLRELIVFFKPSKNKEYRFGLSSIEGKICMQEMFRYLSDFIDFSRLDSLMVEDGNETIEYDRFEIY